MRMEEENVDELLLQVGQVAEMKSFVRGYRGAWFRCKIRDVFFKRNKVQLEYFDFPDEKVSLTKIYQVPHYGRKSKHIKKQLMLRPHYPLMYHRSEIAPPPVNSASEVCVIIDGTWKVGDLVDWFKDNCYWSARVITVLSNDKVQIELPMSPAGEGGTHEAFCRDLRPSLDWSAKEGWRLATMEGESSCSAQLIFPSQQDERELGMDNEATAGGEASSTSRISAANADANAIGGENMGRMNSEEVKTEDGKGVCSSEDSISTFHVEESKHDVVGSEYIMGIDKIELNMMCEETFEAAIMDLEELANKINWIKGSLQHTSS